MDIVPAVRKYGTTNSRKVRKSSKFVIDGKITEDDERGQSQRRDRERCSHQLQSFRITGMPH